MSYVLGTAIHVNGTPRPEIFSGTMRVINHDWSKNQLAYLPHNTSALDRQPSFENFGNRMYMVGGHTSNLVLDNNFRCVKQSMRAPITSPTISVGGGSIPQVGYWRFF